MVLDFARHLRKELGSGIPIIGLAVLPCSGDDPPAKGASAFSALMETGIALDRGMNKALVAKLGVPYETPFNAFFVVPLSPAYGQGKGRPFAHQIIDRAIGDILVNCLNFDLADLLAHVGCNVDLEGKWLHTLSTVSVSYPVQEYIDLTKFYLDTLDKTTVVRKEKREMLGGTSISDTGGVNGLLRATRSELTDIYRKWLVSRGKYNQAKFEEAVQDLIHDDRSLEADFALHLKGAHESIMAQFDELYRTVRAVGLSAPEGTLEARIRKFILEVYDLVAKLPERPQDFEAKVPDIMAGLREDLVTAHQLAPRQSQLVRDVVDLASLVQDYVNALRLYLETRRLADKLGRQIESSETTVTREEDLAAIKKIANPELVVLSSLVSSLISPLGTELRNMDEHLTNCRRMKRVLGEDERLLDRQSQDTEEQKITLNAERRRFEKDMQRVRPLFTAPGKKRYLETKMGDIKQRLILLDEESEGLKARSLKLRDKIREYDNLEKKYQVGSTYRTLVPQIIKAVSDYKDKLNQLSAHRGFYERTGELTESEQLKIMQRILEGDERALSRENVLNEILDRDHLNRYLASVLNLFRLPDTLGLNSEYRTDFLWLTIVSPPGIWNSELEKDVTTALSGYVKEDVSRSLYVRQIESDDPWKVRFLLVAAKARPRWLSFYQDMKDHYETRSFTERQLSHSFLLEYGFHASDDEPSQEVKELGLLRVKQTREP